MSKLSKPKKKSPEFRKIRMGYVRWIMDLVRDEIDPTKYMDCGPIIALVMFDIEGRIDVSIYRHSDEGPTSKRFSGNTKELWADKKLWAVPYMTKKGKWRMKHIYVKGNGLSYNEDNFLGDAKIVGGEVPKMSRLNHYFK